MSLTRSLSATENELERRNFSSLSIRRRGLTFRELLATMAILSIAAVFFYSRHDDGITMATVVARNLGGSSVSTLPPGNGMPTIQIEPLRVIGSPSPNAIAAERLHAKISDAFARFDTINVASNPIPAI